MSAVPALDWTPVALRPLHWLSAALLGIIVIACSAWRLVPVAGVFHDDGVYVITAKALAEGDGYRLISLPDAPPQTKYPPLYPLVLSGLWRIWPEFPANVAVMQIATMLLGALAVAGGYLYLIRFRYCPPLAALATGLLVASSPEMAYFSALTMSEMPFAAAIVLALWRLERVGTAGTRVAAFEAGAAVAAATLVRTAGLAFVLAALVASRRGTRRWVAAGSSAVLGPWMIWCALAATTVTVTGDPRVYYTDYFGAWRDAFSDAAAGIVSLNLGWLWSATAQLPASGLGVRIADAGWPVAPVTLAVGALVWLAIAIAARRGRLLHAGLLAYGALLVIWPWPPGRFVLPIVLLLVGSALGVAVTGLGPKASRVAASLGMSLALVLTSFNVLLTAELARVSHSSGYPARRVADVPDWSGYLRLFAWIRTQTSPESRLAAGLDTMVYLYAGRTAIRPFPHRPDALFYGGVRPPVGTPAELVARLDEQKIDYLVATPMPLFQEAGAFASLIAGAMQLAPDRFAEVYRDAHGPFVVWAWRHPPPTTGGGAK